MEKLFKIFKDRHKTHKAAAKALGVSYSVYNQWRWQPQTLPAWRREWLAFKAGEISPCDQDSNRKPQKRG